MRSKLTTTGRREKEMGTRETLEFAGRALEMAIEALKHIATGEHDGSPSNVARNTLDAIRETEVKQQPPR